MSFVATPEFRLVTAAGSRSPVDVDRALIEDPDVLARLVAHRCAIPPTVTIEHAQLTMHREDIEFIAVLENQTVKGMLIRNEIDQVSRKSWRGSRRPRRSAR